MRAMYESANFQSQKLKCSVNWRKTVLFSPLIPDICYFRMSLDGDGCSINLTSKKSVKKKSNNILCIYTGWNETNIRINAWKVKPSVSLSVVRTCYHFWGFIRSIFAFQHNFPKPFIPISRAFFHLFSLFSHSNKTHTHTHTVSLMFYWNHSATEKAHLRRGSAHCQSYFHQFSVTWKTIVMLILNNSLCHDGIPCCRFFCKIKALAISHLIWDKS